MSIKELASVMLKTKGCTPPKLLGASTTVVADSVYLLGGRASPDSEQPFHMYIFDLLTHTWTKITQPDGSIPLPRYLHSTDLWNGYLVVFGGIAIDNRSGSLYALDDIWFFSILESRWISSSDDTTPMKPLPRYGHLSSISADQLFIVGGQDKPDKPDNWIDSVHLYDLKRRNWIHSATISYQCGTYRGLATFSNFHVIDPSEDGYSFPTRFKLNGPSAIPPTPAKDIIELKCSTHVTKENPSDIYMYLNYDFINPHRELRLYKATNDPKDPFTSRDLTTDMQARFDSPSSVPPPLRFPTGGVIGSYLVLSGIDFTTRHTMSTWTLNLRTLLWTKIEMSSSLSKGSWTRSIVWPSPGKLIIFGSRDGDFKDDYKNRLLSWNDIACIDLEAYGIYQPPLQVMTNTAKTIGLAALEDGAFADFEVVCEDGRSIPCSRELLERRWPWFNKERKKWDSRASIAIKATSGVVPPSFTLSHTSLIVRPDPRSTPRKLYFSEPYPIVVAFLQYLYTQSLMTPLQHAPAVLSSLMLLGATYDIVRLMDLVAHAMYGALSRSREFAAGIFDIASLVERSGLRLRAFWIGRRPGRGHPQPQQPKAVKHDINNNTNVPQRFHLALPLPGCHSDHQVDDGKPARQKCRARHLRDSLPHTRSRNSTPPSVPISITESPIDLSPIQSSPLMPMNTVGNRSDDEPLVAANEVRNENSEPRNSIRRRTTAPISAYITTIINFGDDHDLVLSLDSLESRPDQVNGAKPSDDRTMMMQNDDQSPCIITRDPLATSSNCDDSSDDGTAPCQKTDSHAREQLLLELRHIINQSLGSVASGPVLKNRGAREVNGCLVRDQGCSATSRGEKLSIDPQWAPPTRKEHSSRVLACDMNTGCNYASPLLERGSVAGVEVNDKGEEEKPGLSNQTKQMHPVSALASPAGPLFSFPAKHQIRAITDPQLYIASGPSQSHSATIRHSPQHLNCSSLSNTNTNAASKTLLSNSMNTSPVTSGKTNASSHVPHLSRPLPRTVCLGQTFDCSQSQNPVENHDRSHSSATKPVISPARCRPLPLTPPQSESGRSSPSTSYSPHLIKKIRSLSIQKSPLVKASTLFVSSTMNTTFVAPPTLATASTNTSTPNSSTPVDALLTRSLLRSGPLLPKPGASQAASPSSLDGLVSNMF